MQVHTQTLPWALGTALRDPSPHSPSSPGSAPEHQHSCEPGNASLAKTHRRLCTGGAGGWMASAALGSLSREESGSSRAALGSATVSTSIQTRRGIFYEAILKWVAEGELID